MQHLRQALAVQVFLLLTLILPVLLVLGLERPRLGVGAVAAWSVATYAGTRLALLAIDGSKRLLSLTFWVFVYVWLGITPMLQLLAGSMPLGGSYSDGTVMAALGLIAAGLAAYEIGRWLVRDADGPPSFIDRWLIERELSTNRTIALGLCGAGLAGLLIFRLGGLEELIASRVDLTRRVIEATGDAGWSSALIFLTLLRVPLFIAVYLLVVAALYVERSLRVVVLLALLGGLALFINNPVASPRYWFGTVFLSVVFVVLPWARHYSFSLIAIGAVLSLLFLFPHADMFRTSVDPTLPVSDAAYNPLIDKGDYDVFQQLLNTLEHVQQHGLTYGKQLGGTLLFWMPRRFWQDKPVPSGELVARQLPYDNVNLSMPLWGEMYLDGGVLGVLLVFLGYGYLSKKLETWYERERPATVQLMQLVVPIYAAYQFFLLRGALMSAFAYFIPILGSLLLCTTRRAQLHSADGTPAH